MNNRCQVFTPYKEVIKLLDKVEYIEDLYGKKVIENACGDGNILKVIVERYIIDCLKKNMDIGTIKSGLENDIYGAEIDKEYYNKCIKNLSDIAKQYGIFNVSWKVFNVDILRENIDIKFDYVIGNPPYITYRDLDIETRTFIRENYSVCKNGKFDYCYAFIESSINCLNNKGKLAYLIPNSIFKNVFGEKLREYMKPYLTEIYDYTTKKLFPVLTSSAIIILNKGTRKDYIEYYDIVSNNHYNISKSDLGVKWNFTKCKKKKNNVEKVKFGDYFTASITIATLLNKAFVLKKYEQNDEYIVLDKFKVEKKITKIAVSPRSLNYGKNERIIFPYRYLNGTLLRYKVDDFEQKYPETKKYLKSFFYELENRKSDKNCNWYEYGRTQALAHLDQEKLLLSTIVTKEIKVYSLDRNTIPYAGIYIISKGKLSLEIAKNILQSKEFYNYIKDVGINASGISLRITPNDINNYEFSLKEMNL